MKGRESGMPDEDYWGTFFNPRCIVERLDCAESCRGLVEYGCGYGHFTVPAAQLAKGQVIAFDIDSATAAAITSSPSRRTNRRCSETSRPFSTWARAVPPYQRRLREAARTRASAASKGHGRRERRTVIASTELTAYLRPRWNDLGQVYQITRERWEDSEHAVEVAYRITSLGPGRADAARLLEIDRGYWGIENGLHHVRDVTLGEDACRVGSGAAPQVLAAARNLALGLLHPMGFPSIASGIRRIVMHPIEGLRRLLERI